MAVSAREVANYLIELASRDKVPLTQMKLQKLLYFAHGWYLALRGEPLLEERVQAWNYGPVIPALYHDLKAYGDQPIKPIVTVDSFTDDESIESLSNLPDADYERGLVEAVYKAYGKFTAVQLSNLTHMKGTAWSNTVSAHGENVPRGLVIPDEMIREEFAKQRETSSQQSLPV